MLKRFVINRTYYISSFNKVNLSANLLFYEVCYKTRARNYIKLYNIPMYTIL